MYSTDQGAGQIPAELCAKRDRLMDVLRGYGCVAVALSGGIDSSYLLAAAVDALGADRVLALTANSPLLSITDLGYAQEIAARLSVCHRVLSLNELDIPEVAHNAPRRCYYCKRYRFETLLGALAADGGMQLVHGENADDHLDYRPGSAAAQELGVRAPMAEVGLTKQEIRQLARARGLPNWAAPADACLATRFPANTQLTAEALERVRSAERAMHALLGPVRLRVRDHFPIARLELDPQDFARVVDSGVRTRLVDALRALGYRHVTLDLTGYQRGSLNESDASSG